MFLSALLDAAKTPCLGNACFTPGFSIGSNAQTAGAIVMIVAVFVLAWYGNKKLKGEGKSTAVPAPA